MTTRPRQRPLAGARPHAGQLNSSVFVPLSPRLRFFTIAFFMMGQVVSPALAYALHGGDNPYPLATFGLQLVFTALTLAPFFLPLKIGLLHPLVFPTLFTVLRGFIKDPYYLLSPFSFLVSDYQQTLPHEALTHYGLEQLAQVQLKVLALNILGLLAFYAGYAWVRPRIKRRKPRAYAQVAVPLFLTVTATGLAALIFIYFRGGLVEHMSSLAFGRAQALSSVGYLVAFFYLASIGMFVWYAARPSAIRSPAFLGLLIPVALMPFVVSGSRSSIFIFAIEMGLLWVMQKRRLPAAAIAAVLLMAPAGLIALGVLGSVRSSAWSTGEAEFSAVTAFDVKASLETGQAEIIVRRTKDGETGVIAEGLKTTGYLKGETYVAALLFWVPRAIWPDKPRGVAVYYVSKILSPGANYGVPVGPIGEAYWNFGYLGIVVVMALWGAFRRWLADYYAVNGDNPFFRVFYLIAITIATPSSDSIVLFMQQTALLFAVFLVLNAFNRTPATRRAGTPRPVMGRPRQTYRAPTIR